MSDSTPQIEAILDELTAVCCEALEADKTLDEQRVARLVDSLSKNGWKRHSRDAPPLATVLENRVRERCREPAIHRGASVESVTQKVQRAYNNQSRYEASSPSEEDSHSSQNASDQARSPRSSG